MNETTSSNPEKIGKYVIENTLGMGAMGVVYRGLDPNIGRPVAIKVIKKSNLDSEHSEEVICRFKREAQAAGSLSHPNIATIYEFGESESVLFLAMEYVEGQELAGLLKKNERFSLKSTGDIIIQLLDALHYSHQNRIVHRDIKPANIMVKENGQIKIMDFGIAHLESSDLTQLGSMMGTPSYMAPEQFMGHPVDQRVDVYASGVILYQLLTGEKPFYGENATTIMHKVINVEHLDPTSINMHLPVAFNHVLRKALAKRLEDRFQTVEEFKESVIKVLEQADVNHDDLTKTVIGPSSSQGQESVTLDDETLVISYGAAHNKTTSPKNSPLKIVVLIGIAIVGAIGLFYWLSGGTSTEQPSLVIEDPVAPQALYSDPKSNKVEKSNSPVVEGEVKDQKNSELLVVEPTSKPEITAEQPQSSKTTRPKFSFKSSAGWVKYIDQKKTAPPNDIPQPALSLELKEGGALKSPIRELNDDEW